MSTPSIQTLITQAQQVLNLKSSNEIRATLAAVLANANVGTPLNPNLTTQQLWDEFYEIVRQPSDDIMSIITDQMMRMVFSPPAPGGAGADKQVIFNDGGVLAGDTKFLWDKTANRLDVDGPVVITGDLTVDTTTLVVNPAGYADRVGIGTATPLYTLDVNGNARIGTDGLGFGRLTVTKTTSAATLNLSLATATGYTELLFTNFNDNTGASGYASYIRSNTNAAGNYSSDLVFGTSPAASGGPLERYKIASDGVATWSYVGGVSGTAMTLNSTGLLIGGSTNTTSSKLVAQAGTSNAVQYSMIELRGGSSSGANQLGLIRRQTTAAVSNSAVTIYGTCTFGELIVVTGTGTGNIFADLLMVSYNTVSVISSNTQQGSPAARTYSISTGNLQLTMGSATSMAITSQAFTAGGLGL